MKALLVLTALVVHGVPMPRGSHASGAAVASSKSYRDTVDWVAAWLDRKAIAYKKVGPYRARGVDVTRFLSQDPATEWLAIHVWSQAGTTWISVVVRTAPPSGGAAGPAQVPPGARGT